MRIVLQWLRPALNFCLALLFLVAAIYHQTCIYLCYQARGQLSVLFNTQSIPIYKATHRLTEEEESNLRLVEQIKRYSADSLGYKPTVNYTDIYDQSGEVTLWVITACEAYDIKPYEWYFPIVGTVSYKGFFKKELAQKEYNHLVALGYDADLRSVSAWSTLGWFSDPLLSSMLQRSKGGLCNLLFHELFHATYFAPGKVELNENLASFIAHKATLLFLRNDTAALNEYKRNFEDNAVFDRYMLRQTAHLRTLYADIKNKPDKLELKLREIYHVADSIGHLSLHRPKRFLSRKEDILKFKNAYLIDFQQYDSRQDSLEKVFNKFYAGSIKKMVHDLRSNKTNY